MSAYSLTDVLFTIPHSPAAVSILRDRTVLRAARLSAFRALFRFTIGFIFGLYLGCCLFRRHMPFFFYGCYETSKPHGTRCALRGGGCAVLPRKDPHPQRAPTHSCG